MQINTIGFDLVKNVFQVHGIDAKEKVVVRKQLRRGQVMAFFKTLPPCLIGKEACATEGRGIDPWIRGNEWVMKMARTWGANKITLLAFWDGREQGVGTGGTAQVVQLARDAGNIRLVSIDSRQLLA
jgi:hypothetical protein